MTAPPEPTPNPDGRVNDPDHPAPTGAASGPLTADRVFPLIPKKIDRGRR